MALLQRIMTQYCKQAFLKKPATLKYKLASYLCTALEVKSLLKHSGMHLSKNFVQFSSTFNNPEANIQVARSKFLNRANSKLRR